MNISSTGLNLIKRFEGCRTAAYRCAAGVWTIGYGHTAGVVAGMTITQAQADEVLQLDLEKFEKNVNKYTSKYKWSQNEFDALTSFAFNLGSIDKLTALGRRNKSVIAEKMPLYNKANGKALAGLASRRKAEQELFLSGSTEIELPNTAGLSEAEIKTNIVTVQKWLNTEYHFNLTTDGIFGTNTKKALCIALQNFLNDYRRTTLALDGVYGPKTNNEVVNIARGNTTAGAKIVQAILFAHGYNPQQFAESFKDTSVECLKIFQEDKNLNADGIAGKIFFSTTLI